MHLPKLSAAVAALITLGSAPPPRTGIPRVPVAAPTTANCLIASNAFVGNAKDPRLKAVAQEALYFYLGRIDPRTTRQQLASDLKRGADSLKGTNAGELMNACVRQMAIQGDLLKSVGPNLQPRK